MLRWISQVATSLLLAAVIGLLISGTAGDSRNPTITQLAIPSTTTEAPPLTTTTTTEAPNTTTTSTTSTSTTTSTTSEVPLGPDNPGNSVNCSDFSSYSSALDWFNTYFSFYGDVAELDADGDGEPCETLVGGPEFDEEAVLLASYPWGPSEETVILQTVLGIDADGWYGPGTRSAHLAELAARGLSVDNVPPVPTTTTTTPPPTTTVDSGLPDLSYLPSSTLQAAATAFGAPCLSDGILTDCPASVLANIDAILALLGV